MSDFPIKHDLLIAEANQILDDKLTFVLRQDYGLVMPEEDDYVSLAKESLADPVWFAGNKLYQIDQLGDISSTEFASYVEQWDVEDYYAAGSSPNENVEIFEYDGESAHENYRRALSTAAREMPFRVLREELEERYGVDVANSDAVIE